MSSQAAPRSPGSVLYRERDSRPMLPVCDHYCGSPALLAKSLTLQGRLGPVLDITADCEDGAPAGDELGHALRMAQAIDSPDNRFNRVGARTHPVFHGCFKAELDTLMTHAGHRLAYLTLPKVLLQWRGLAKLKSTYTDKLPEMADPKTGRVHTTYSQAVAITGRLASSDPNLQNIPVRTPEGRRIREAFIAPPGHQMMSADYSQIELRIMAHISQDAGLLKAFADGEDVHRATASEVFGVPIAEVNSEQRRYAKVINFGLIYGMSAFGLAANLGIERGAAQAYIDRYFARYPGVAAYMERTRAQAREQGYVETVFGRRLWLPEIGSSNMGRRQMAERAAINAPMQGTAADLIKLAMIDVHAWLRRENLGARLVMQVHDELVLEVPDAEVERLKTDLPARMAGVAQLSVPLLAEVGVGENWEQAH